MMTRYNHDPVIATAQRVLESRGWRQFYILGIIERWLDPITGFPYTLSDALDMDKARLDRGIDPPVLEGQG